MLKNYKEFWIIWGVLLDGSTKTILMMKIFLNSKLRYGFTKLIK